jgi:hypothetical protein
MRRAPNWLRWTLVWVAIVTLHTLSSNKQRWDSTWTLHVAHSIWYDGNIDLSEFADLIEEGDYRVVEIDGRLVSVFPDGAAFLAAPIVGLMEAVDAAVSNDPQRPAMDQWNQSDVQEAIASIVIATTCLLLGWIGMQLGLRPGAAMLLALIAAFGTPFWSTMSRALWSHTAAALAMTAAMGCLLAGRSGSSRWWLAAGLWLGFAFVCRPTTSIPIAALTCLAFAWDRRKAWWLATGGAVVAVLFVLHNLRSYGTPLPWYYLPGRLEQTSTFGVALLGNLISPSRGFLLYVPIWVLAAIGFRRLWKDERGLVTVAVVVMGLHWVMVSRFGHWWGGFAYGPRLMSDITPYLMLGMIGFLKEPPTPDTVGGRLRLAAALVIIASSTWIHYAGATLGGTNEWNSLPEQVGENPGRLWDWSDMQMFRQSAPKN